LDMKPLAPLEKKWIKCPKKEKDKQKRVQRMVKRKFRWNLHGNRWR
jgi:hypothetical protein